MSNPNNSQSSSSSNQSKTYLTAEDVKDLIKQVMGETVKTIIGETLPAVLLGIEQHKMSMKSSSEQRIDDWKAKMRERCPECHQAKVACGEKHVMMIVAPKNRRHEKWFPGVLINGVAYKSNGGRPIPVPANNDIASILDAFESAEDVNLMGREGGMNLGAIGQQGSNVNLNQPIQWRDA